MAKSNTQKLERLYKLTVAFKDVSEAVSDIIDNSDIRIDKHTDIVKSALVTSGYSPQKAFKIARGLLICLCNNRGVYSNKYPKPESPTA